VTTPKYLGKDYLKTDPTALTDHCPASGEKHIWKSNTMFGDVYVCSCGSTLKKY
jgi:predicted RNA-binding Zn-ribbon protein involved in translation (DUF1610 family)